MELLAPAGSIEKLSYVYKYGADAAYIGIKNFSLRARADNFSDDEFEAIRQMKGDKKLYCALNIFFHDPDIKRLEENLDYIQNYPFDGFIISDIGVVPTIRKRFPDIELHLSTQANCVNSEAAKMYRDMGFSRIIPGRELSLAQIEGIKNNVPDLEVEVFVHGAMCLAYSGRCFLSSWMTGRSANKGDCAHSCRWNYQYMEEQKRPGEFYPIEEGENFTTVMSSKDLCMIDHLQKFKDAGVDSLKIEGRMKSIYYAAVTTRAYRKQLDALEGKVIPELDEYKKEIYKVSHREFSTGFFFDKEDISIPTEISYERKFKFLGSIGKEVEPGTYELIVKNQIKSNMTIQYIGPDILYSEDAEFQIFDENGTEVEQADHGKIYTIKPGTDVQTGYILRVPSDEIII